MDAAAGAIGYGSVTLHGVIDPHGSNTSYYFQYGPTAAYGAQTPLADAGAGTARAAITVPVGGPRPLTVYHYRLIAVNAAGAATGAGRGVQDREGAALAGDLSSPPNPTVFPGSTATVQGTLSGTGNAGRRGRAAAENPFPYTAGFADVGNPELTTATGSFSFPVVGLAQATQFRVVTTTTLFARRQPGRDRGRRGERQRPRRCARDGATTRAFTAP